MENFQFLAKKSWYKQWWGMTIITVGCILIAFITALTLLAWRYHNLIKQGYGVELRKIIYGNQQPNSQLINTREELESKESPFLGNAEAKNVIVEFIDFSCPICKEQDNIIRQVINKYGQKIKLVMRNFPAETLYPGTSKLSEMAYCAHEQELYWPAHDYLFSSQDAFAQNLTVEMIGTFISEVGLDKAKFNACLVANNTQAQVKADYLVGSKFEVAGTPTFFINGYKVPGNIPLATWEEIIESLNP